jgi:hypothetical protein
VSDINVDEVAAALADAAHAGGLSEGYYRTAADALARVAADLERLRAEVTEWRTMCDPEGESARLRELIRMHRREIWIAPDGVTIGEIHSDADRMLYESALGKP